jgi:hypothetical protein
MIEVPAIYVLLAILHTTGLTQNCPGKAKTPLVLWETSLVSDVRFASRQHVACNPGYTLATQAVQLYKVCTLES